MRAALFFLILTFIASSCLLSQESEMILLTDSGKIKGTLLLPKSGKPVPVVLIIAGSGPTDRNGNNSQMENNSLRMIADSLCAHGIASLRYDKRGVGASDRGATRPSDIVFDHFVSDARGWISLLQNDKRFSGILIAGHSEGSLIGMIAAQKEPGVLAFISIAGPGRPLDVILKEQLSSAAPEARAVMYSIIDKLKAGDTVANVPPLLSPLFRRSVQPFLISIFRRDPAQEISRLDIPVLILQGTTDIQVSVEDAELLAKAGKRSTLKVIANMNHVLKDCDHRNRKLQQDIYDNPRLPLNAEFARQLTAFCIAEGRVRKAPPR